jgi:hypothetical protein
VALLNGVLAALESTASNVLSGVAEQRNSATDATTVHAAMCGLARDLQSLQAFAVTNMALMNFKWRSLSRVLTHFGAAFHQCDGGGGSDGAPQLAFDFVRTAAAILTGVEAAVAACWRSPSAIEATAVSTSCKIVRFYVIHLVAFFRTPFLAPALTGVLDRFVPLFGRLADWTFRPAAVSDVVVATAEEHAAWGLLRSTLAAHVYPSLVLCLKWCVRSLGSATLPVLWQ